MSRKLFVGNLPYSVTSERLQEAFSQFGTVTSSKVIVDRETGRSRGFAFLEMETDDQGASAMQAMNGALLDGRSIAVREAVERQPGGGGGGGLPPPPVPPPPVPPPLPPPPVAGGGVPVSSPGAVGSLTLPPQALRHAATSAIPNNRFITNDTPKPIFLISCVAVRTYRRRPAARPQKRPAAPAFI